MAPQFTYKNGEKELVLEPLKGQIDPEKSEYTVGKVKVEVRLHKMVLGRWGVLVGDSPDGACCALCGRNLPFPGGNALAACCGHGVRTCPHVAVRDEPASW